MTMEEPRRAIVVGASSGIGAAIALELAAQGYDLALVGRRTGLLAEIAHSIRKAHTTRTAEVYPHDVRSFSEVGRLFEQIVEDLHGLDWIVYVAGVMPRIGPDEYEIEKDREIVEVNLLGAMAWLNEAARWFTAARTGTVVGVSSMAGERGRRGNPAYCSSKAALNTYLEALRNRLGRYGVHVLTVKPGFVRTAMLKGREEGTFWVISPEEAARKIVRAAARRKKTVFVPARWGLVAAAVRAIPSFLFRRIEV
jgi:short-subunit dehydrogenase